MIIQSQTEALHMCLWKPKRTIIVRSLDDMKHHHGRKRKETRRTSGTWGRGIWKSGPEVRWKRSKLMSRRRNEIWKSTQNDYWMYGKKEEKKVKEDENDDERKVEECRVGLAREIRFKKWLRTKLKIKRSGTKWGWQEGRGSSRRRKNKQAEK